MTNSKLYYLKQHQTTPLTSMNKGILLAFIYSLTVTTTREISKTMNKLLQLIII